MELRFSILMNGCGSGSFFVEPNDGEPLTLFKSSKLFHPAAEPAEVVIRSSDAWTAFLASYPTSGFEFLRDRFYHVDYDRHMVVGLAFGGRGRGSISVNIDSLHIGHALIVVFATEFRPTIQTRDLVNPAHFIVVPKSALPVEFAEVRVVGRRGR